MSNIEDYLTISEVARLKGVTPMAIRYHIKRGTLKAEVHSGLYFILKTDADALKISPPRPKY